MFKVVGIVISFALMGSAAQAEHAAQPAEAGSRRHQVASQTTRSAEVSANAYGAPGYGGNYGFPAYGGSPGYLPARGVVTERDLAPVYRPGQNFAQPYGNNFGGSYPSLAGPQFGNPYQGGGLGYGYGPSQGGYSGYNSGFNLGGSFVGIDGGLGGGISYGNLGTGFNDYCNSGYCGDNFTSYDTYDYVLGYNAGNNNYGNRWLGSNYDYVPSLYAGYGPDYYNYGFGAIPDASSFDFNLGYGGNYGGGYLDIGIGL